MVGERMMSRKRLIEWNRSCDRDTKQRVVKGGDIISCSRDHHAEADTYKVSKAS